MFLSLDDRTYPLQPMCDCWHPSRCTRPARYILVTDEGKRCPGGPVCKLHGRAIVSEYREKIFQQWGLRAIKISR